VSDEEAWAQRANSYLDCSAWGPPPWSADQLATLRVVLDIVDGSFPNDNNLHTGVGLS